MSIKVGPAHAAALIAFLVAACGTTVAPAPTASVPAETASPTASAVPATASPTASALAATVAPTASPAGVTCFGDDLLWGSLPPPAQAYALAWLEGEQAARVGLLEEGMTEDGSFADPEAVDLVTGLPAVAEHIGAFQEGHEGHFFRVRAWETTDVHHDFVRVRWILCRATDAKIALEGEDILLLDETGLIQQVTRFIDA